ncbi:hypothetical protein V1477_006206 [Vespula maculifrons]|uniref:Uncharacterized protein n=1 Tax=Vespula maculifrons TaxID=7453 RepID=A0ABD2CK15_VESMC
MINVQSSMAQTFNYIFFNVAGKNVVITRNIYLLASLTGYLNHTKANDSDTMLQLLYDRYIKFFFLFHKCSSYSKLYNSELRNLITRKLRYKLLCFQAKFLTMLVHFSCSNTMSIHAASQRKVQDNIIIKVQVRKKQ